MATPLTYPLPKQDSLKRWRETLQKTLSLQADAPERYRVHFYDSFDWRLFGAGKLLEWQQHAGNPQLCLRDSETPDTPLCIPCERQPPRFPADLPAGALRRQLAGLIEMRALLPVASIDTRSQCFRLTDREGKTRVRLFLEQHRLARDDGRGRSLGKGLRIAPLHGYARDAQRVVRQLERELGLRQEKQDLLAGALSGTARTPGDYSTGIDIPLQAALRADAAVRRILLVLLKAMETNESGVTEDIDSEFLHDFRVAVRRSRAALGQMKRVFPPATLQRYRAGFAWLGSVTGPTRDLDVYLLKFPQYQALLPAGLRAGLEPLRDFLEQRREREQEALRLALQGARYRSLKQRWRRYLNSALPKRPAAADACKAIGDVAQRRTWRMYRRVLAEGGAITPQSPPPELHELRKSCKKLRYLMEFFQSLYPAAEIRALIRILKVLQDNLGDFQDLEVQVHALAQFEDEMNRESRLDAQSTLAMDTLRATLQENMMRVRSEFDGRFRDFGKAANRRRFRRLFHPRREQQA